MIWVRPNILIFSGLQLLKQPFYTLKATFLHIFNFLRQLFYTLRQPFNTF